MVMYFISGEEKKKKNKLWEKYKFLLQTNPTFPVKVYAFLPEC